MRPEHHPRAKKLALALLTPYWIKNKLRTIQPQNLEKIKNSQPELKFTGSYKKKSLTFTVILLLLMLLFCYCCCSSEFRGHLGFYFCFL